MKRFAFILMLTLIFAVSSRAQAATPDEQRSVIQDMQKSTLNRLYKLHPAAKRKIAKAAGYAVFSSADVAAIFFSGAYGHGLAHDNKSAHDTYMQMASAGVGLGLGAKDYRLVFVFNNAKTFHDFVDTGLDLSGHADVAAKQGAKGAAVGGEQDVLPGVRVYQLTKTGLMAQVMLRGTKYWRDNDLNQHERSSSNFEKPIYNN